MKSAKLYAAAGLLTLSAAANAGVTSTWTLASDYDFRGITQSAQDPAVQASVDYAHDGGWVDGSDLKESDGTQDDVFSSEARALLSIATTFPWR